MMPYLFTSDALVFKPFNETPRRFNQNRSFKVAGSLPAREAPGISSSDKAHAAIRDNKNNQGKATTQQRGILLRMRQ